MASKMVVDHEKLAGQVAQAGEAHADLIGERLKQRVGKLLRKGESMPDFALAVRLLARAVVSEAQALSQADEAHEAELADDVPLREERDAAVEALYPILVDLRDALLPAYGIAGMKLMKLATPVSKVPAQLLRTARDAIGALRGKTKAKPKHAEIKIDREGFAAKIEPHADALTTLLRSLDREARELQKTQEEKNRAFEIADQSLSAASYIFWALLTLIGEPRFAAQVEPIAPTRSRPSEDQEAPEGEQTEEAADEKPA